MIRLRENIDLKDMTTFGLPAECGRLVEFDDFLTDLPELDRAGLLDNAMVIGGGSNLLFISDVSDRTFIHCTQKTIRDYDMLDDHWVDASAGVVLDDLCAHTSSRGLWGLENLSGIPGNIGGAAVQNVGAYGTEFKDVVQSVFCYSPARHDFLTVPVEKCRYGYRDSVFKHQLPDERLIVCSASFRFTHESHINLSYQGLCRALALRLGLDPEADSIEIIRELRNRDEFDPETVRRTILSIRDSKLPDPSRVGSAGSFFKNPVIDEESKLRVDRVWREMSGDSRATVPSHIANFRFTMPRNPLYKISAAWLIDHAGCKGMTCGGAALWQQQPLVIVNADGEATGRDVFGLEQAVIARVKEVFGITLVPEVVHI